MALTLNRLPLACSAHALQIQQNHEDHTSPTPATPQSPLSSLPDYKEARASVRGSPLLLFIPALVQQNSLVCSLISTAPTPVPAASIISHLNDATVASLAPPSGALPSNPTPTNGNVPLPHYLSPHFGHI